jgi:hypothetical protein
MRRAAIPLIIVGTAALAVTMGEVASKPEDETARVRHFAMLTPTAGAVSMTVRFR